MFVSCFFVNARLVLLFFPQENKHFLKIGAFCFDVCFIHFHVFFNDLFHVFFMFLGGFFAAGHHLGSGFSSVIWVFSRKMTPFKFSSFFLVFSCFSCFFHGFFMLLAWCLYHCNWGLSVFLEEYSVFRTSAPFFGCVFKSFSCSLESAVKYSWHQAHFMVFRCRAPPR